MINEGQKQGAKMIIEQIKGEKLQSYRPIFIDRRDGSEDAATYTVSLFPSEVIAKQVAMSTKNIVVMFKQERAA